MKKLIDRIENCNGGEQKKFHGKPYCPLIKLGNGNGKCTYRSSDTIKVETKAEGKTYRIPMYKCNKIKKSE